MGLLSDVLRATGSVLRGATRSTSAAPGRPAGRAPARAARTASTVAPTSVPPGRLAEQVTDWDGPLPTLAYAPAPDDHADPGEVVWAWVPYEEADGRGKDRPVLVLAAVAGGYVGVHLTSNDHDRDRADEERWGRHWLDVGSGAWDRAGRASEVRLDRLLQLPDAAVRREGAALSRSRYDEVAAALRALHDTA